MNKYLIICLLLFGCTTNHNYQVGDCFGELKEDMTYKVLEKGKYSYLFQMVKPPCSKYYNSIENVNNESKYIQVDCPSSFKLLKAYKCE